MKSNILTPLQERVLTGLFDKGLSDLGFFLTGGTALSEFYLQHRESEDLDFFTRKNESLGNDFEKFKGDLTDLGLNVILQTINEERVIYNVSARERLDEQLKVEFVRDTTRRIDKPYILDNIIVDSLEDIAVNKVCTVLSRTEIKDFCDLYFILRKTRYSLDHLISRARLKEGAFDTSEGALRFAVNLRGIKDLNFDLIARRMIKPLTFQELSSYLISKADDIIFRLKPQG